MPTVLVQRRFLRDHDCGKWRTVFRIRREFLDENNLNMLAYLACLSEPVEMRLVWDGPLCLPFLFWTVEKDWHPVNVKEG